MEQVIKTVHLEKQLSKVENLSEKFNDLCHIVKGSNSRVIDKIQRLLPMLKVFDCHRLKAALQDLKRAGKLQKLIQNTPSKNDLIASANGSGKKREIKSTQKEEGKGANQEGEVITPNKVSKPRKYYAGVEALRGKKKISKSFRRREALDKKGWGKDNNQMTIDKFLVPKRKKKVESTQLMMMTTSDSYT